MYTCTCGKQVEWLYFGAYYPGPGYHYLWKCEACAGTRGWKKRKITKGELVERGWAV